MAASRAATAVPSHRRLWHYLEMLLAMAAGMLLLTPVAEAYGLCQPTRRICMAGTMTAGMVV
jgi:hypothetical protein